MSALDDYFTPLCLEQTRLPASKPKKECSVRSPVRRSIRFADESQDEKQHEEYDMLETVLLFEPDESFSEASVVEAINSYNDSCSSFDSWEYAHGGNCPSPTSVNLDLLIEDPTVPPVIFSALKGPSSKEIEREVREQYAQEKEATQQVRQRKSAPAVLMTETPASVKAAKQMLKKEGLNNAREQEKNNSLEDAAKQRKAQAEEARVKKQQQEEKRKQELAKLEHSRKEIAKKRASFEQSIQLQKEGEEVEKGAQREKDRQEREAAKAQEEERAKQRNFRKEKQIEQLHAQKETKKDLVSGTKDAKVQKKVSDMQPRKFKPNHITPPKDKQKQRTLVEETVNQWTTREEQAAPFQSKKHESKSKAQKTKVSRELQSKLDEQKKRQLQAEKDAVLLQKTRNEAADRQQRAKEETEKLGKSGAVRFVKEHKDTTESTAAHNAMCAQQKRKAELQDVAQKALYGGNVFNKRERSAAKIQTIARGYNIRCALRRYKRRVSSVKIQKVFRGFVVRKEMAKLQEKISSLEGHLKAMEEAKQEELESIRNDPEIISLIEQLDDAAAIKKRRELEKEKVALRGDIASIKDGNERIRVSMENLRENNRRFAKHTQHLEEENGRLQQRIRIMEKTQQNIKERADRLAGNVGDLHLEIAQADRHAEIESRIATLAQKAITKIREHARLASQTSQDRFLSKVRKRSHILQHLRAAGEKRESAASAPAAIKIS